MKLREVIKIIRQVNRLEAEIENYEKMPMFKSAQGSALRGLHAEAKSQLELLLEKEI